MSYATMLTIALPEIVLSLGALPLMLAAAWGGQAAARPACWAALVVLAGAGTALPGPPSTGLAALYWPSRPDPFPASANVPRLAPAGLPPRRDPDLLGMTRGRKTP